MKKQHVDKMYQRVKEKRDARTLRTLSETLKKVIFYKLWKRIVAVDKTGLNNTRNCHKHFIVFFRKMAACQHEKSDVTETSGALLRLWQLVVVNYCN